LNSFATSLPLVFTPKKVAFSVVVLLIFHAVGFRGLACSNHPETFQALTPLNLLLTAGLDFFFEPVAMLYDFWSWQNNKIPVQNYFGWFGLAFILQLYFQHSLVNKQNALAIWVVRVQGAFFILINYAG
jgi:uncharacterized membrane protein